MSLDINTPKGQKSLEREQRALQLYNANHEEVQILETDKTRAARIDGFFFDDEGFLSGIFETRSRNLTDEDLLEYNTWLVTYKKLRMGKELSRLLRTPFYGLLYLIPEDKLLVWQITDEDGDWLFEFDTKRTPTQRTINGGRAYRENAFLPLNNVIEMIDGKEHLEI